MQQVENQTASLPLFDLTSMLAVEALFRSGVKDPWARAIVSKFTDMYIFCDTARYTAPFFSDSTKAVENSDTFPVLQKLIELENSSLHSITYRTDEQITLNVEYMVDSFKAFENWCVNNKNQLKSWLKFHQQEWIRGTHNQRFKTNFLYPTQTLSNRNDLVNLSRILNTSPAEICYTFDLVLRYSLIGQSAGENQHYLAHPIREEQNFPTMNREPATPPNVPVQIGRSIVDYVAGMSLDEYTVFLHEARQLVREMGIVDLKPKTIEKETLRELAYKLWLPPKLKNWEKAYGIITGGICGLGAYPVLGPVSAALGGLISISSIFWSGSLPACSNKLKLLRWAYEWEIEKEARDTE